MPQPDEYAVSLRNLEKRFGDFAAVDRISLDVGKGEIFGFLGPNGAGKSTTIRMLCGILPPSGGSGTVAGFDVVNETESIKKNIGYMSQRFSLYEDLTVEENIDFYSGIYRIAPEKRQVRKDWVIRMAGLESHRNSPASVLSGGWKQRWHLAAPFSMSPHRLSRRAHLRRGPGQPPQFLGSHLPHGRRRHNRLRHHPLHGRS
nr:ABC transporter ATP-binding protein [Geotalea toluenoxydans]